MDEFAYEVVEADRLRCAADGSVAFDGLGPPVSEFKVLHVPSKYMLTALSTLSPHLPRIKPKMVSSTLLPTKASKVALSNGSDTVEGSGMAGAKGGALKPSFIVSFDDGDRVDVG